LEGADSNGQAFRFTLSPAPGNAPGGPLDGVVTVLPAASPGNVVQSASSAKLSGPDGTGLPNAALSAALAIEGLKSVVTVGTPTGTLPAGAPPPSAAGFFQVVVQQSPSGPALPLLAEAQVAWPGSAPLLSAWEELDWSDLPRWDMPGLPAAY